MGPAVEGYDAGFMNHLVTKDHITGTLNDLVPVVVHDRNNRPQQPSCDASIVDIEIVIRIRLATPFTGQTFTAASFFAVLLGLRRESGQPSIRRINDKRRLPSRFSALGPVGW